MMLLGRKLLTDYKPLELALAEVQEGKSNMEELRSMFPGILEAVVNCFKELESRRLRADTLTYFNFRFQAWADPGFDADPSMFHRVIPAGVVVEDDDPTTTVH